MNKRIRFLMNLVLLVGSALLSAPTVGAHTCDPSPMRLEVGQQGTYRIRADGVSTTYTVTQISNPSVALISPTALVAQDGVFTVQALAVGETTMTILWTAPDFNESDVCVFTVIVTRATNEFPPVQENCGITKVIHKNNTQTDFPLTIRATNMCNFQFFAVRDKNENLVGNDALGEPGTKTFTFDVPSGGTVTMSCGATGTGTACSYLIQGFGTTPDKQEGCGFGPEPIYKNSSGKNVDVTIQATSTCNGQIFQVKDQSGNQVAEDLLEFPQRSRIFTFTVPSGGSIEMRCVGGNPSDKCSYSLGLGSRATRDGEVPCGRGQRIFTNTSRNSIVDVTVRATAFCKDGATISISNSSDLETISEGQTSTRTFMVLPRGNIMLNCKSDPGGGNGCPYTIIEGT